MDLAGRGFRQVYIHTHMVTTLHTEILKIRRLMAEMEALDLAYATLGTIRNRRMVAEAPALTPDLLRRLQLVLQVSLMVELADMVAEEMEDQRKYMTQTANVRHILRLPEALEVDLDMWASEFIFAQMIKHFLGAFE